MSHMIDMSNGRANMAYVGEKPWHRLGEELQPGADLDTWRIAAGLDWEVERVGVQYTPDGTDTLIEVPKRHVLYRSDTKAPLGVVADKYKPVQPGEVLEFYRDLVEKHGFQLETAGSLKGGKLYWALASTGDDFKVHGSDDDRVESKLLLATGNDGSMATRAQFTSVRVVCWNTLSYAVGKGGAQVKVSHASEFDADQVKIDLGIQSAGFDEFHSAVDEMAHTGISKEDQFKVLADLYYPNREDDEAKMLHVYRTLECIEEAPGAEFKSARGTVWGALNGVTRYIDHDRKAKSDDTRLQSAWFGGGEALKQQMWDLCLKQINAEKVAA